MTAESSCRSTIDHNYASFLADLPIELAIGAERLPRRLELATRGDIGWGEVFDDAVVLGLPSLVLRESNREVRGEIVDGAERAHLFAMLVAQVSIAVASGEVEPDRELDAILGALERERNRALAELRLLGADADINFSMPEREVLEAVRKQRDVFEGRLPVTLADYLTISTAKQSLAFPAVAAGAVAAKFEVEELGQLHDLVLGAMLGVQIRNDVEAWLASPRSRSWIVALSEDGDTQIQTIVEMLDMSRDALGRAADAARELGAVTVMTWARHEANGLRELERMVERNAAPPLAG